MQHVCFHMLMHQSYKTQISVRIWLEKKKNISWTVTTYLPRNVRSYHISWMVTKYIAQDVRHNYSWIVIKYMTKCMAQNVSEWLDNGDQLEAQ